MYCLGNRVGNSATDREGIRGVAEGLSVPGRPRVVPTRPRIHLGNCGGQPCAKMRSTIQTLCQNAPLIEVGPGHGWATGGQLVGNSG